MILLQVFVVHLAELVQVQNLSLHMRESDFGSLQLPELCYLIQKVELNSGEGLAGRTEKKGHVMNIRGVMSVLHISGNSYWNSFWDTKLHFSGMWKSIKLTYWRFTTTQTHYMASKRRRRTEVHTEKCQLPKGGEQILDTTLQHCNLREKNV